ATILSMTVFDGEPTAQQALDALKPLQARGDVKIKDAAVLVKTVDGKTSVRETDDVSAGQGAALGAVSGGIITALAAVAAGAVAGPIGVAAVAGALVGTGIGAGTAAVIDRGFPNDELKQLVDDLDPGTSALLVMVEDTFVQNLEKSVAQ